MNPIGRSIMKAYILSKVHTKGLQSICLATILITLVLPGYNLSAGDLNECLTEALKTADDSVTVGQLRKQCGQKSKTDPAASSSPDNTTVQASDVSGETVTGNNGPEEIVLKTPQAKKPAYFPHRRHQDKYTCGTCHHGSNSSGKKIEYDTQTAAYKCTDCHNAGMSNTELNSFKLIGHALCRQCHRKNQDITSAKCSTCHRKNL